MHDRVIDMLTPRTAPAEQCVMGNVAIARGAIEAGVQGVFAYPGTPSTEISEVFAHLDVFLRDPHQAERIPEGAPRNIHFEYSINEKIALEKAIAFSIGGGAALCVMKNVGMNVASDALMSIGYQTIGGPLVIALCDDPGCHSSSNEQDSRHWGAMANVPVLDPAGPQEAMTMVREAFALSRALHLPVILRSSTRVSHARGVVRYGSFEQPKAPEGFERLAEHINIPARTAAAHLRLLEKLQRSEVAEVQQRHCAVEGPADATHGIIASGVARAYVDELLHRQGRAPRVPLLHLGMVHPFPSAAVAAFLSRKGLREVLVLEELDPIVEDGVRTTAQRLGLAVRIHGKGHGGVSPAGEFSLDLLARALGAFLGADLSAGHVPVPDAEKWADALPPRPPVLCAGCPHRATFYLLKLAIPREESDLVLCGDIGCFGLGALPPLKMIDTINHMGMSISMAQGLGEAFRAAGHERKTVALVGDGTFFHSGLNALVNAVYTRADILVVIFDNRTIGMTGHQAHPGAAQQLPKYHEIDLLPLLRGLGIGVVEDIDPFDLRGSAPKLQKAMAHRGVSVLVARAPCIFLPAYLQGKRGRMRIVVDPARCNTCGNHADSTLHCSRCGTPRGNLARASAMLNAEHHVPGEAQACPANICNHGFFNAILEGDTRQAVELVRDKMLFAHTCGEVCHRPCELFSDQAGLVPIKALKRAVSEFGDNYLDISAPLARARAATPTGRRVAIVGAGPAGLSAAYDLVQAGYEVDIHEKEERPGGMVAFGIPSFRMNKEALHHEAMLVETMGARFHFGRSLGDDLSLRELARTHDAVVLAIGQWRARTLDDFQGKGPMPTDALAFLRSFNSGSAMLRGEGPVLVIGGGNSAIDAARAARRIAPGRRVVLCCLEPREEMPAFADEVAHAEQEGVEIVGGCRAEAAADGSLHVDLLAVKDGAQVMALRCGDVITAIGQASDERALAEVDPRDRDAEGRLTGFIATGLGNVIAAGDLRSGNHTSVIGAIASGKRAAVEVRRLFEGYVHPYEGEAALRRLGQERPARAAKPLAEERPWERLDLFQACAKCDHCITSFGCPAMIMENGKVRIDAAKCTLCGLCIDVCPNRAIRWEAIEEPEPATTTAS